MTWGFLYLETFLSFAVLMLLGAFLLLSAGARNLKAILVCSPLASMGLLGILSVLSPFFSWSFPYVLLSSFCFIIALLLIRLLLLRSRFPESLSAQRSSLQTQCKVLLKNQYLLTALLGILIASLGAVYVLSGLSLVSPIGINAFDEPFHYSVVRHILESGNASPIGAGSVMGSQNAIYPDLWHAFTALLVSVFGETIVIQGWATCLLFLGFFAPAGVTALSFALFKTRSVALSLLAPVFTVLMPHSMFLFIGYGSLFANLAGLAMIPLALAAPISLVNSHVRSKHPETHSFVVHLVAILLLGIITLGFAHPSSVIIFFLLLLPLFMARVRRAIAKILVLLGAVVVWVLLQRSPLFFRTINCLDVAGYGVEKGVQVSGWLGLDYAELSASVWLPLALFFLVVLVGIAVAIALRKLWSNSWYLVSVALLIGVTLTTLLPMNWFSIIASGYFYRDIVRLMSFSLFFMTPFCAGAFGWALKAVREHLHGALRISLQIALALLLIVCLGLMARAALATRTQYVEKTSPDATLSPDQVEFMENVALITGDDVVLNNDTDDSHWLYPLYGINALLKGNAANQMSSMDENLCFLIEHIGAYGEDSELGQRTREAAEALDVEYVTKMSDNFISTMRFNELDQIDYKRWTSICNVTPGTPGFELIYELNGMELYKLN